MDRVYPYPTHGHPLKSFLRLETHEFYLGTTYRPQRQKSIHYIIEVLQIILQPYSDLPPLILRTNVTTHNTPLTTSSTYLKIHSSNLDVTGLQKLRLDFQIFKNLNLNLQLML